jgi:hypothetical protein
VTLTAWCDTSSDSFPAPLAYRHTSAPTSILPPHTLFTNPTHQSLHRQDKAKAELHGLLEENELEFACLLVVANKQDMATALKPDVVAQRLEVEKLAPRLAKVWIILIFLFSSST